MSAAALPTRLLAASAFDSPTHAKERTEPLAFMGPVPVKKHLWGQAP